MNRRSVYLVDDDVEIVANIATFLRDKHFDVRTFSSGDDFFKAFPLNSPAVIVLDMQMPGLNGLDIQARLNAQHVDVPIFFLSGDSKSQQIIDALKNGAYEFLLKPVMPNVLLDLLTHSFEQQANLQSEVQQIAHYERLFQTLTDSEKKIFAYLIQGFSNKGIAELMGLKADTIKKRRAQIYQNLQVEDLPELIKRFGKISSAS